MQSLKAIISIILLFTLAMTILQPSTVKAHTSLSGVTPAAGSQLDEIPEVVKMTFSSKIADNLSSASIYNETGTQIKNVTESISDDQKSILLTLPELTSGTYTVNYNVVSIDGHPVEGTYSFTLKLPEPLKSEPDDTEIGEQEQKEKEAQAPTVVEKDKQKSKADTPTANNEITETRHEHETSTYLIRLLYFFTILSLAGWVMWGTILSIHKSSVSTSYLKGSKILRISLLFMLVGYGYLQFKAVATGLDEFQSLIFQTPFGIGWLIMIILSILGFFILYRSRILDGIWVILLLFGEVLIGHAIANEPILVTTILDLLHLVAAAIWVGGLLLIVTLWKNHRIFIQEFLPVFSRYAMYSILTLTITGSLMTILFLPDLSILVETLWGKVLLFKIAMVLALIILGSFIRKAMKNNQESKLKNLVEWDFGIMIGIVLLVSILTFVSPKQPEIPNDKQESTDTTALHLKNN